MIPLRIVRPESKESVDPIERERFERTVLPHLRAAYNLARWLTRSAADAEDVVQEAYLRAYQFFDSFHGGDGRAWLLRIVRNTCYTWLEKNRPREPTTPFDETRHSAGAAVAGPDAPLMATTRGVPSARAGGLAAASRPATRERAATETRVMA